MKRSSRQPQEGVEWQRSSRCSSGECVEVKKDGAEVSVRNSQRSEAVARFDAGEWAAFVAGVKDGEFG